MAIKKTNTGIGGDSTFISPGDYVQAYAILIEPRESFTFRTKFLAESDPDKVGVVTTSTFFETKKDLKAGKGTEVQNAVWANGAALVRALTEVLESGDEAAVRITKGENKKGNPPWIFDDIQGDDLDAIMAYMEDRDGDVPDFGDDD